MLKQKIFMVAFVFCCSIGACGKQEPKEKYSIENIKTGFFMGSACVAKYGHDIVLSGYYPTDAAIFSCVSANSERIHFAEKQLKITLLKNGLARVQLNCLNEAEYEKFLSNNYDKDILLVFNNTLIWSFHENRKNGENDCGQIKMTAHEDAVLLCLSAQEAWGGDEKDCSTSCKNTNSKVCLDN
jgi:hypothetical protein